MLAIRFWLICVLLATAVLPARAQDRPNVVASFSILGDFVRNVGGDRVNVTTLVGPNSDVHVYAPTPADAKKIADAKLVIVNGFGLEGWLPRLVQSAGSKAVLVTATSGIAPLKLGSDADPHAWQSVVNAKIYVANIRDALVAVDPADAETFRTNADAYLAKLDALDREVREAVAQIPDTQIKQAKIPAVFLENISDPRLIRQIAAETGAKVGGTLYSDSLTGEKGDSPTYIDMVRHNIKALTHALAN